MFFGLEALSTSGVEKVLIHDGARPFVSPELILRVLDSTKPGTAAVPGVLATDSLREIDEKGMIIGTVDRSRIMQVQTPKDLCMRKSTKSTASCGKNLPQVRLPTMRSCLKRRCLWKEIAET